MFPTIIPAKLQCPFESAINPFVLEAERQTIQWLRDFRLVEESLLEFYRQQGFAHMVSRMFPKADSELLCDLTKLNTLLFLVDDIFDHQSDKKIDSPEKIAMEFMMVLRFSEHKPKAPLFQALKDIWDRICTKSAQPDWVESFIRSFEDIFLAAKWQDDLVNSRKAKPDLDSYIAQRQFLGAANIATDSLIPALGIHFDPWIFAHPVIAEMTQLTRNSVCWANDIFSLSKEEEHGDGFNYVSILMDTQGFSREDAIEATMHAHNKDVLRFISFKAGLDDLLPKGITNRDEINRYIAGLENIMRGNIDWSDQETTRYHYSYLTMESASA